MKAEGIGSAGQKVRDERLAAGRRVIDSANQSGAHFVLIAGDLFEHNAVDRTLVQKTADILSRFHGPVYLIPGNHDPLVPGCVWDHPAWRSADNLHVLTEEKPVEISGGLLFPCPIRDKHSRRDPTTWIKGDGGEGIRVGIAHGNVSGLPQADPDHPIARDATERARLDYLALGHWHSTATYTESRGIIRMAYSGTHETSQFGERDSGNTLLIDIAGPGSPPNVVPIQTGRFRWHTLDQDVSVFGDLRKVRLILEGFDQPDTRLLNLRLKGLLYVEEQAELYHLEDLLASRFLYAHLDASGLLPSPQNNRWVEALPAGALQEAALRLQHLALSGQPDSSTAARALLELYALAGDMH